MFCLVRDNDTHWYVIPVDKKGNWERYCESESYGYDPLPDWAEEIGGSPHLIQFPSYIWKT